MSPYGCTLEEYRCKPALLGFSADATSIGSARPSSTPGWPVTGRRSIVAGTAEIHRRVSGLREAAEAEHHDALNAYSQDFVAQDKCKEVALNQIDQSSDVVFQVAGQCGLGALTAAKDSKVWGIGVDSDQSFLGPHILTSAQKKVDVGVAETIRLVTDDAFVGGVDGLFNVKNKGVGYGKVSADAPDRAALIATLDTWAKRIATGDLTPPRNVTG